MQKVHKPEKVSNSRLKVVTYSMSEASKCVRLLFAFSVCLRNASVGPRLTLWHENQKTVE